MNARQEIKDYVVLPRGQDNCLPPHSMILDFTMSHDRYRRSNVHPTGKVTSRHLYDDFFHLIFLHSYPETSVLGREWPEESDQFQFLRTVFLSHLKGCVGLILGKDSTMRISIPLESGPIHVYDGEDSLCGSSGSWWGLTEEWLLSKKLRSTWNDVNGPGQGRGVHPQSSETFLNPDLVWHCFGFY